MLSCVQKLSSKKCTNIADFRAVYCKTGKIRKTGILHQAKVFAKMPKWLGLSLNEKQFIIRILQRVISPVN